jgi:hypothetical protein
MRTLAFAVTMMFCSTAWSMSFVPDARLAHSPFPVEVHMVEFVPQQGVTVVRGRAINRSGLEQRDVAIAVTFFQDNSPVATVGEDLGHMFDMSYAFFEFHIRGDITSATSYGVVARSTNGGQFYEQPYTIWDGYAGTASTGVCIPCVPVARPDLGDPTDEFVLSDLAIEHDKETGEVTSVRGKIANHSKGNLPERTYFAAVFYDENDKEVGSMGLSVPHITRLDTVGFVTHLTAGNFKARDNYELYITH